MATRFADVVYWAATAAAFLWLAFVFFGISTEPKPDWSMVLIIGAAPSAMIWLGGRAVRYVLTGV